MKVPLIDVWDLNTFDSELRSTLEKDAALIWDHFIRNKENPESSDKPSTRPSNRFSNNFEELSQSLTKLMRNRHIRAFHYTRLTCPEVKAMIEFGIHPSTPESLKNRVEKLVQCQQLSRSDADYLIEVSPFECKSQMDARCEMFWMVSHPLPINHFGVELLLESWGGEVATPYSGECVKKAQHLIEKLQCIGLPRVVEIALPLSVTSDACCAANSVAKTFARSLGFTIDECLIDLCAHESLSSKSVIEIHTLGEEKFERLGINYPPNYVPE